MFDMFSSQALFVDPGHLYWEMGQLSLSAVCENPVPLLNADVLT